ncbi:MULTISPECIES: hypothetical protein [Cellulomonas]|nr:MULTISPECIES: hypothetical protein [Cellulomonas]
MNYVLNLQEAAPVVEADDVRSCNLVSFASCSICSLSVASVALCLG